MEGDHSVALRLTYGNVRFNLTGGLNREAMARMRRQLPLEDLEAEIVKAPHHGSHDFDLEALRAMSPVVAMVSSGDESVGKEYIHPRATLMASLGKVMRGDIGVLLCAKLAAFFGVKEASLTRKVPIPGRDARCGVDSGRYCSRDRSRVDVIRSKRFIHPAALRWAAGRLRSAGAGR